MTVRRIRTSNSVKNEHIISCAIEFLQKLDPTMTFDVAAHQVHKRAFIVTIKKRGNYYPTDICRWVRSWSKKLGFRTSWKVHMECPKDEIWFAAGSRGNRG